MRNLLLFFLALGGIWWVRRMLSRLGQARRDDRADKTGATRREALPERIVECAHCGLLVPETEGVSDDTGFYCSEAHRRAGPRRNA
ncbi:MAG: hypothetical protein GX576_01725 [Thauera phenolivorans]|uniref:Preprotein translocase subunit YajC n=1 Tax=Thauera phenolivorans TaxID=1792543 RepID=A0A7X7R6J2_9RHOO|nr:PP0621 family protein [Thauera phenolivorans]NLF53125.1 hypothetical protein [Thauera phenolivorans]